MPQLDPTPGPERKYSPGERIGARKEPKIDDPDPRHISTSHVERQNLNIVALWTRGQPGKRGPYKKISN